MQIRLWRVVLVLGLASCLRTLETQATQPNPLLLGRATDGESQRLAIVVGHRDMDVPGKIPMRNTAYFKIVSRDRLRFHVTDRYRLLRRVLLWPTESCVLPSNSTAADGFRVVRWRRSRRVKC